MSEDARYRGWLGRQDTYAHWNLQRFKVHKRLGLLPKPKPFVPFELMRCSQCHQGYREGTKSRCPKTYLLGAGSVTHITKKATVQ